MNSKHRRGTAALAAGALCALGALTTLPAAADIKFGDFSVGGDLRLREVYVGYIGLNQDSLTPTGRSLGVSNPLANRVFQRYRIRGWGQWAPSEHFALGARLMYEGRHYTLPPTEIGRLLVPGFQPWYVGGILFDGLTLDFKKIFNTGLSLKAGRQDIIFGNGWLVLDGTPIDGSRTIYMDAARATYAWDAMKTTIDLVYINNAPNTDRFPKPLNGTIEDQIEQWEQGAILYVRNKSFKDTELDGYLIYKENRPNYTILNRRVNNGYPFSSTSDDGQVYAVGARIDTKFTPNWSLRAEAAGEWGANSVNQNVPSENISAFGFNGRLGYAFNDKLANKLHLDFEYLSGDDPNTSTNEAFDPLWGRWPQWSELMIYQWPLESRVGQATNLYRLNLGWSAKLLPTTEFLLDYHALWADQQSVRNTAQFFNISHDGTFRGHLFTGWVKSKFNKWLSGHLVAEYLAPGDYYAENRRNGSYFLRAEVVVAF